MGYAPWFADLKFFDVTMDSTFPNRPGLEGSVIQGHEGCRPCPVYKGNSTTDHQSYGCQGGGGPVAPNRRINLKTLRDIQYQIARQHWDVKRMAGSEPGFFINCGNGNFADATGWKVIETQADTLGVFSIVKVELVGGGDPRALGLAASAPKIVGPPQPGDRLEPLDPSCLAGKVLALVERVEVTATYAILYTDANLANLEVSADPENLTPDYYQVKTWRQSRQPETWMPVRMLVPMVTEKRTAKWTAEQIDDGVLRLYGRNGHQGAVSWPVDTVGEVEGTFEVKLKRPVGMVSVSAVGRVFTRRTGMGEDGLGRFESFLCLGSVDPAGNAISTLLDGTEEAVYATYWMSLPEGQSGGCIKNTAKCKYSVREYNDSDFGTANGLAYPGGKTWGCARRWFAVDIGDEGDFEWRQPTGLAQYAPHCALVGTCDQFTPETEADWFSMKKHLSGFLRACEMAVNYRIRQVAVGLPTQQIERVAHPSMAGKFGGPALTSPGGLHELVVFPDWGIGYVGPHTTTTDEDGNEDFANVRGAYFDTSTDLADVDFDDIGTYPGPGVLSLLEDWQTKTDPFGTTLGDLTDLDQEIRHGFYRSSPRIDKDTGWLDGRGAALYSRLGVEEAVLVPRVDLTLMDEEQDCGDAVAVVHTTPVTVGGAEYDLELRFKPITLEGRVSLEVIEAVIAAAEMDTGLVRLEFENQSHHWSYTLVIGPGDSTKIVKEFKAGGGVVRAADWLQVQSYDEDRKSVGGVTDLCSAGDGVEFLEVSAIAERLFVVTLVQAFGGEQAADWGEDLDNPGDIVGNDGETVPGYGTGVEFGRRRDVAWLADESGILEGMLGSLVGKTVKIWRQKLVAHGGITLKAAPWREEEMTAMSAEDYLWWPGSGKALVKKSVTDGWRAEAAVRCFKA